MRTPQLRYRVRAGLVLLIGLIVGLSWAHHASRSPGPSSATQLRRIETTFNGAYRSNDAPVVWAYFDAASRALIPESRYVRWHSECPSAPGAATTLAARALSSGWWEVDYEISGVTLRDYWHYQGGQWRFSLIRSNPSAAKLYSSTFAAYADAMGCSSS